MQMNRRAFSAALVAGTAASLIATRGTAAMPAPPKARNVVLVHGLFADGSCWSEVIARLQAAGLNVTAVQNPLTTLPEAVEQLEAVAAVIDDTVKTGEELVTDKGYHSKQIVLDMQSLGLRTYISEPDRGRQHWIDQHTERDAVYANRRRIRGERGQQLMRRRGELLERPNAHLYDTGGMRRTHLRGHGNILKRLLVHAAACNLGLWMRTLTGIGTPRGLQGRLAAVWAFCFTLWVLLRDHVTVPRHRGLNRGLFAVPSRRFALIPSVS